MLNNFEFCFYDTETTGLNVLEESILEMAFIDCNTGDKLYHEYIYPSNQKKITNSFIHKIDETVLKNKNALNINDALKKLNKVLKNYYGDKNIILVAHNNFGYDQLILESEYKRANISLNKNILFYDSLPFFRKVFTDCISYKLGNLYKKFIKNKDDGEFHTALYDTECLFKLFRLAMSNCNIQTLYNDFYIRLPLTSKKIYNKSIKFLSGYYYSMKLEEKGIRTIKDMVNIYILTKKNEEYFREFLLKKYNIYSKASLNKFVTQMKLII